jgi:hypothetical protein
VRDARDRPRAYRVVAEHLPDVACSPYVAKDANLELRAVLAAAVAVLADPGGLGR